MCVCVCVRACACAHTPTERKREGRGEREEGVACRHALRGGGGDDVSLVTHVTHCSDDVTHCSDDLSLVTHCSLSHMPQVAVILLYMCV